MFDPTIALLDALLVPASAKPAQNGAGEAEAGAFEALLAGLGAAKPARPDEAVAPTPGATLPDPGKPLPHDGAPLPLAIVPPLATGFAALPPNNSDGDLPTGAAGEPGGQEAPPPSGPSAAAFTLVAVVAVAVAAEPAAVPTSPTTTAPTTPAPTTTLPTTSAAPAPVVRATIRPAPLPTPALRHPSVPLATRKIGETAERTATVAPQSATVPVQPGPTVAEAKPIAPVAAAPQDSPPETGTGARPQPQRGPAVPVGTAGSAPVRAIASSLTNLPHPAQQATGKAPSAALRRASETRIAVAALTVAPEPVAASIAPIAAPLAEVPVNPASVALAAPLQPAPLPDHRALVDALVRARAERDPGVSVALETREFGAVALRFEPGDRGLQVALSSADPGFDRAVASAAAAQAALSDQASRNPAQRTEPTPMRSDGLGDAAGGRAAQSDSQANQRAASESGGRESRARPAAEPPARSPDQPVAPRPDRRRGAIFA